MKNKLLLLLLILFTPVLFSGFTVLNNNIMPSVYNGYADISNWNFEKNGILNLDGYWEFYPNKLISPEEFLNPSFSEQPEYIKFSQYWTSQNNGKYKNVKYATYRAKIHSQPNSKALAFQIPVISSSYNLWINGNLSAHAGIVSYKKENFVPETLPQTIHLSIEKENTELVFQVSDFSSPVSGISNTLKIGTAEQISQEFLVFTLISSLFIGFVFALGVYHIVIFFFRKQEFPSLLLSFTCISFSIWYCSYTYLYRYIINFNNYELFSKIEFLCIVIFSLSYYWFINQVFPEDSSRKAFNFFTVLSSIYGILIIFSSYYVYRQFLYTYDIAILVFLIHTVYISIIATIRKREGAIYLLAANIISCFFLISEMANIMHIRHNISYSIISIAVIMFAESCILALKFRNTFVKVEQLSEKLLSLDKLKDDFLANTSHELKTPINGIIGISESMLDGAAGELPSKAIKNLEMIVSSGKRLASLINDILDFSKLKNKDVVLNKKNIDLKQITEVVSTVLQTTITKKNLVIINAIDPNLPYAYGDENRTEQILYNLIGNALKFTKEGYIQITAKDKNDFIEVCVEDTGIGIPENKLEDIFKSFEQVDSSISREVGGTGLGLSITKQLVELQGGQIYVESVLGKGSKFYFTIPKSNEIKAGIIYNNNNNAISTDSKFVDYNSFKHENKHYEINLTDKDYNNCTNNFEIESYFEENIENLNNVFVDGVKILAVDDEEINLQVLKNQLEIHNYYVDTASNGLIALEKLQNNKYQYDLILLDIMMPKMSGFEVCKTIRSSKSLYELPVIILTAKNQPMDIVAGFNAGANDYLVKPFEKNELLARVKTLISLKKSVTDIFMLNREIENTQREIIYTLGEIAELRSKETGNHVRRVSEYSYLLAKKYGLSEEEANLLKLASTMHDVGKIGIRDDILNKPGKLTPEEFEVIKTHSLIGYEMLKNSNRTILKTAAIVALEHHEKYNGKGYPKGLKGEEISIYGRITAIADVFDALASNRVYKKAWEMDKIIELFKEERGEHFDPVLTDIFLNNIDEFIKIKESYKDSPTNIFEFTTN